MVWGGVRDSVSSFAPYLMDLLILVLFKRTFLGWGGGHFEVPQSLFRIVIKFERMTRVVLIGYPVYRYSFNLSGWGPPTYPPPHQILWDGIFVYYWEGKRGGLGGGW